MSLPLQNVVNCRISKPGIVNTVSVGRYRRPQKMPFSYYNQMITVRRYMVNMVLAMLPPTRGFLFKRFLWRWIGVSIGDGARIGSGARIWGTGSVSVGNQCWLGMNLTLIAPLSSTITIESDVDIGPDVLIECGTHKVGSSNRRAGEGLVSNVSIGAGTWVGCRATILGGAILAPGTIVGAGALVLPGSYPTNAILAGVPARIIRILDNDPAQ